MKKPKPKSKSRVVVETRTLEGVLYQRELVRCGNARCKRCKRRPTHGPYWYAYRWSPSRKRLVSSYVGKAIDEPVTPWPTIRSLTGVRRPLTARDVVAPSRRERSVTPVVGDP